MLITGRLDLRVPNSLWVGHSLRYHNSERPRECRTLLTSRACLEQCPGEVEVERGEMLLTTVLQGPGTSHARFFFNGSDPKPTRVE